MKNLCTILIPLLLASCCACVFAQSKTVSLAYQVTHVDNGSPSISPDGKRIVYTAVIAGKGQLLVANLDGSEPIQITRDEANHNNPVWSPDGTKIAYGYENDDNEAIYILGPGAITNPSGSPGERITIVDPASKPPHRFIHPNWSPDGKRIIYCSTDDLHPPSKNDSSIYSMDLETREITTLITGGINTYPAWSPDGTKIVFRKIIDDGKNSEVFVAASDGTGLRNLTNNAAFDGWPAWSPDGTQIVFCSNRRSNFRVFLMNSDGSNVRPLAQTEGRATEPRWSPDGKTVYFSNCASVAWGTDCQIFAAATSSAP